MTMLMVDSALQQSFVRVSELSSYTLIVSTMCISLFSLLYNMLIPSPTIVFCVAINNSKHYFFYLNFHFLSNWFFSPPLLFSLFISLLCLRSSPFYSNWLCILNKIDIASSWYGKPSLNAYKLKKTFAKHNIYIYIY